MFKYIQKIRKEKKEYKAFVKRVDALPNDYKTVFDEIQHYLWQYVSGNGYQTLNVLYDLLDLFEQGVQKNKNVLEITGDDVASFSDSLLESTDTYLDKNRDKLNKKVSKKLGSEQKK